MTIRTLFQRIVPHIVAPSLAVLAVLGACSSPNTVVSPAIALNPDDGGPDTEVIVTGTDFPPATEVNVRLGPPDVGATPQSYGRAVTDAAGSFALSFVMPAQWPDGEVITETELVVVAINQDASVKATAPFHFVQVSDASTSDSDSGLVQAYANAEGDFSLLLPPNWEVMGPAESELGPQYLLGPAPLSDRQAPANGSLFIADAGMLSAQEAAQLLCGGCVPPPELEEAVLNGQGARRAIITGPGLAELEWFFIEGNGKTIFFSIHDPDTLETLDGVVQTFNFGRTPTGPAVIPAAQRARQMLAEHLDIDPYRIIIASAEPVEWADVCLGAPAVDELCRCRAECAADSGSIWHSARCHRYGQCSAGGVAGRLPGHPRQRSNLRRSGDAGFPRRARGRRRDLHLSRQRRWPDGQGSAQQPGRCAHPRMAP
jgi:hypothetical protein